MDIEVLDLEICPNRNKIARVSIRYFELVLKCELVYYVRGYKLWIRMPEKWFTREKKTQHCFWPSQEISDRFQREVLKIIFDKYDLNLDKVIELHRHVNKKRNRQKTPA